MCMYRRGVILLGNQRELRRIIACAQVRQGPRCLYTQQKGFVKDLTTKCTLICLKMALSN